METIGTAKLDEKARIVLPGPVREALELKAPDKYKGSIGSIVAFKRDEKGRIIIEKV